jgi:hypothetical protein
MIAEHRRPPGTNAQLLGIQFMRFVISAILLPVHSFIFNGKQLLKHSSLAFRYTVIFCLYENRGRNVCRLLLQFSQMPRFYQKRKDGNFFMNYDRLKKSQIGTYSVCPYKK